MYQTNSTNNFKYQFESERKENKINMGRNMLDNTVKTTNSYITSSDQCRIEINEYLAGNKNANVLQLLTLLTSDLSKSNIAMIDKAAYFRMLIKIKILLVKDDKEICLSNPSQNSFHLENLNGIKSNSLCVDDSIKVLLRHLIENIEILKNENFANVTTFFSVLLIALKYSKATNATHTQFIKDLFNKDSIPKLKFFLMLQSNNVNVKKTKLLIIMVLMQTKIKDLINQIFAWFDILDEIFVLKEEIEYLTKLIDEIHNVSKVHYIFRTIRLNTANVSNYINFLYNSNSGYKCLPDLLILLKNLLIYTKIDQYIDATSQLKLLKALFKFNKDADAKVILILISYVKFEYSKEICELVYKVLSTYLSNYINSPTEKKDKLHNETINSLINKGNLVVKYYKKYNINKDGHELNDLLINLNEIISLNQLSLIIKKYLYSYKYNNINDSLDCQ